MKPAASKKFKLSELFEKAVNENQPFPNIDLFKKLANVTKKVPTSIEALKNQVILKMKSYMNGITERREMYFVFCLCDYLVQHGSFIQSIEDSLFVKHFEMLGQFLVC